MGSCTRARSGGWWRLSIDRMSSSITETSAVTWHTDDDGRIPQRTVSLAMRRLALLGAVLFVFAATSHAQERVTADSSERGPRAPGPIAETAEKLARELWPEQAASNFFVVDEQGRPRFRSGTTATVPRPAWQLSPEERSIVPSSGAISHQEMVRFMTPQEFSTPLIAASVDPGSIMNEIKKAWRDWQARRIHERVTKERENLERINAEASAASK